MANKKNTNNQPQNITQKTKDRWGGVLDAQGGHKGPAPHMAPVVLLLLYYHGDKS